jgi:hypothetical protein
MSDDDALKPKPGRGTDTEPLKRQRFADTSQTNRVAPRQPTAERRVPPSLAAAFDASVEDFDRNPAARAAALAFMDACAPGKATPAKILMQHAGEVTKALTGGVIPWDRLMLIHEAAEQAAKSALCHSLSLFDCNSVSFPLGDGRSVQVLVKRNTQPESMDSPLYRHTAVKAFEAAYTKTVAAKLCLQNNPLPLLYGASGSGKTMCGISVAVELHPRGACLRLRCGAETSLYAIDSDRLLETPTGKIEYCRLATWRANHPQQRGWFTMDNFESVYSSVAHGQAERNMVAQYFVLKEIEAVISEEHRGDVEESRPLVVFIDEAGQHPTFVRAMCACFHDLQATIRVRFSNRTCPVSLILAGTGIECADNRVGSEHSTVFLCHVRPDAWSKLRLTLPYKVRRLLAIDTSTLVRLINGMVLNARVAAKFAIEIEKLDDSKGADLFKLDPMLALRTAAVIAAQLYKQINRRGNLSDGGDFAVLLLAMAQQTSVTELGPLSHYGLLVDRAQKMLVTNATQTLQANDMEQLPVPCNPQEALYLSRTFHGVRYEVEIAQTMMLQLVLKLGVDQQATPRGFETACGDFTAMAMEFSRMDVGMNFTFFRNKPPWTLPHGWNAPLLLAERLRGSSVPEMVSRPKQNSRHDVARITNSKELSASDADCGTDENVSALVKEYIATHILAHLNEALLGSVVTNCGTGSYAHVMAFFRETDLLLIRAKMSMEEELSVHDVFEELHNMGNRDWRSVLAKWYSCDLELPSAAPAWLHTKLGTRSASEFAACIENEPPADQDVQGWLKRSTHGAANPVTEQLRGATKRAATRATKMRPGVSGEESDDDSWESDDEELSHRKDLEQPSAESETELARGDKPQQPVRRVTYVIMAYGKEPPPIPVVLRDDAPALCDAMRLLLAQDLSSLPRVSEKIAHARQMVAEAASGHVPATLLEALSTTAVTDDLSDGQRRTLRSISHALSVPDDVLLLYAPHYVGRPTSGKFAAAQLWGYYPIVVNPPLTPSLCEPIPRPQIDLQ